MMLDRMFDRIDALPRRVVASDTEPLDQADYFALARGELPRDRLEEKLKPYLSGGRRADTDSRVADAEIVAWLFHIPGAPEIPADPDDISLAHADACDRVCGRLEDAQRIVEADA